MGKTFKELATEYGAPNIPNALLYEWLEEHREDLKAEASLGVERLPNSPSGQEIRRRSKCDLMWLARYFTWRSSQVNSDGDKPISLNLIDEQYYSPVLDLFVKKDCTKPINEQDEIKTRLLLWPRGGMKSTCDHLDTVQWILNWPDIRILYLTAEVSLAEGFVGEIKGHFQIREEEPTWMNLFFPEYCFLADKEAAEVFTCPLFAAKKMKRKEPTVTASSVGKHKAGRHYELIKADDAVSDVNTATPEQCVGISQKLFLSEKLLELGGYYIDYIGTRYADEDHYGVLLEKYGTDGATVREGQGWTEYINLSTGVKILIGRALQIKPEVMAQLEQEGRPVTYQEAGPENCIFLLPHLMPFPWCMNDFSKDEKSFEGQRNQNPRPASTVVFDRRLLLKNTIPYNEMPHRGPVSQTWDFAFSKKKGRDYSTCCSVVWAEVDEKIDGKATGNKKSTAYVQEVTRGKYNQLTLAKAVVDMARKYRPFIIGIENAGGSDFLAPTILAEAYKTKDLSVIEVCSRIDWFAPDNQKDAKKVRMGALYPWLVEGQLKFANYCMSPNLEILYSEFESCLTSHHHDDVPDVISQQPRYMPAATQAIVNNNEEMYGRVDPGWNLIFEENTDAYGRVGFGPPSILFDEVEPEPEINAESYNGMAPILGAGMWG